MTLETCRGTQFYVIYIKIVYQVGINKGIILRCTAYQISRTMRQVRFKFRYNILIGGKIIKEMPGSLASGTPCTLEVAQ